MIGIVGGSGAGKSTLSHLLLNAIGKNSACVIAQDNYYRDLSHVPFHKRTKINFDHLDDFDNDLFLSHIIDLAEGKEVQIPIYDYFTHSRTGETQRVSPMDYVILEGLFLFTDRALRKRIDLKVFVDVESDLRFIRRLQRDIVERGREVHSIIKQYLSTVKPMYEEFVKPQKEQADMIISGNNNIEDGLSAILSKMRELML